MKEKHNPNYISQNSQLEDFCDKSLDQKIIAVDTEFISERRYWPQLCLVQLATDAGAVVVDVQSSKLDVNILWNLLLSPKLTKVFHASMEDVAIIKHETDNLPAPFFDTQLAAMFCTNIDNPGYATLAKQFLNVTIDKSQQKTNWLARPLDERQINYALGDVTHLLKIYKRIINLLMELERLDWVQSEHKRLSDNIKYRGDPFEAWRRIHLRRSEPLSLAILREIAAWRDLYARKQDKPPTWILSDQVLAEIAQTQPRVKGDLDKMRSIPAGLRNGSAKRDGLWRAIERGLNMPKQKWPTLEYKPKKAKIDPHLAEVLKLVLNIKAREYKLAPSVITNASTLRAFAADNTDGDLLLKGWRRTVFGETALKFKHGKAALRYNKGQLIIVDNNSQQNSGFFDTTKGAITKLLNR